jgi:Leucine-rich repeat (LRR) protein
VVDISEEGVSKVEVEEAGSEFVLINGNPFSVMRKSIDLSDLRINNNFVVEYLSAFSKMKNLSDLQIRNNTLTKLGYTMLFNTLPQL